MKRIKLTQGKFAIVDDDMFEHLSQFKWYSAMTRLTHYAAKKISMGNKKGQVYMHHMVIGYPLHGKQVDHINRKKLDNRKDNLRIVTLRENAQNRTDRADGKTSSRFHGVYWNKNSKAWLVRIIFDRKRKTVGTFDSEERAGEAYQEELSKLKNAKHRERKK